MAEIIIPEQRYFNLKASAEGLTLVPTTPTGLLKPGFTFSCTNDLSGIGIYLAESMPLSAMGKNSQRRLGFHDLSTWVVGRARTGQKGKAFFGTIEHEYLTILTRDASLVKHRKAVDVNDSLTFLVLSRLRSTGRYNYGQLRSICTLFPVFRPVFTASGKHVEPHMQIMADLRIMKDSRLSLESIVMTSPENWAVSLRAYLQCELLPQTN